MYRKHELFSHPAARQRFYKRLTAPESSQSYGNTLQKKLQQITAGTYQNRPVTSEQQLSNIYAIYDYLNTNFKYEAPPEPDFIFQGSPKVLIGGQPVAPNDYLDARNWMKNGNPPPRPTQQQTINTTSLNTDTLTPPAAKNTPRLLDDTGVKGAVQALNDTRQLQANADQSEPRTLIEVAGEQAKRELTAKNAAQPAITVNSELIPPPANKNKNINNWIWIAAAAIGTGLILIRRN